MLTSEQAELKCQELIQAYVLELQPHDQEDIGKGLSKLLSMAVGVMNSVMGADYTTSTLVAIAEYMASGEPQKRINVTVIDKSQLN
jgi:hypothetical protein